MRLGSDDSLELLFVLAGRENPEFEALFASRDGGGSNMDMPEVLSREWCVSVGCTSGGLRAATSAVSPAPVIGNPDRLLCTRPDKPPMINRDALLRERSKYSSKGVCKRRVPGGVDDWNCGGVDFDQTEPPSQSVR